MPRNSRRLKILLLWGLLLVATTAVLLLASFDLNHYRQELADSLSRELNEPVAIGSLHFSYDHGLALDCSDLQIGNPASSRFSLAASAISLRLRLLPLFSRQLQFRHITLRDPLITLHSGHETAGAPVEINSGLGNWLQQTRIKALQLQAGRLRWYRTGNQGAVADAELQLDLEVDNLRPNRQGRIALQGALLGHRQATSFELTGSVDFPAELADWPHWQSVIHGRVNDFDPRHWLAVGLGHAPAWSIERIARGELLVEGAAATGLEFTLKVAGEDFALAGTSFSQPVVLPSLQLQATWLGSPDRHEFQQIDLRMGGMRLGGSLTLERGDDDWNLGLQGSGTAPLPQLLSLFPDQGPLAQAVNLRGRLHGGTLTLTDLQLQSPLRALSKNLQLTRFRGSIDALAIDTLGLNDLQLERVEFAGTAGQLSVSRGDLSWLDTPVELVGRIDYATDHPGDLDVVLSGSPTAQRLADLAPQWLAGFDGALPGELHLAGNRNQLSGELRVDLGHLRGGIGQLLQLPDTLPGSLQASLRLTPETLFIDQLALQLPGTQLSGSGELGLAPEHPYLLQLQQTEVQLEPLRAYSPLFERLELLGSLSGELQLSGRSGTAPQLTGRLDLQGGGVHLTRVIGDLQQLDGSIALTGQGLRSMDLRGLLGESPVVLEAQIENFRSPAVRVRVLGETVRAHDLIFPSTTAELHDLDGRLLIDGHGIRFDAVRVRLPGGTRALVRGMMTGYAGAHVGLRIDAEYGNIDEVIALWHHTAPLPPRNPRAVGPTVAIDISVEQGQIGDLRFSNAYGQLTSDGQGHLVIYPLKFASGAGFGVGHVSVESTVEGPSLLKISGHVENFDAAAIHQELLHRSSLVSGTLRGDFYLEGRVGESFVATSRGGFSARISNGELKRFRILGKVFSLLNVSQLFSFKLPDMTAEGMPFDELTATARLNQGVLSTEDLLIHSNSMDIGLVTDFDLKSGELDGVLAIKPLKTVDNLISKIPIAGWIIGGDEQALITAQFTLKGKASNPEVTAAPVSSISRPVIGILKRILQLPGKLASDMAGALGSETGAPEPSQEPPARQ